MNFGALSKKWTKPIAFLIALLGLACFLPDKTIGPWGAFPLRKIASIIFALASIQVLGALISRCLGSRAGAILAGFFGGLVSSTATTASLARKSRIYGKIDSSTEILKFLSATLAMLFEGIVVFFLGIKNIQPLLLLIFFGPFLMTSILIFHISRKSNDRTLKIEIPPLEILPILKLSVFIIIILFLSKVLQNTFGQSSLLVFTFIVSLFEIHGSIIANIELYNAAVFNSQLLGSLLAVSIGASYVSKLSLISILGSKSLKSYALKYTALLFLTLFTSWLAFLFFWKNI